MMNNTICSYGTKTKRHNTDFNIQTFKWNSQDTVKTLHTLYWQTEERLIDKNTEGFKQ